MTENAKLSYWYCDECQRTLNHGEYRYTCTVCDEFDYCEACMAKVDPPHPHRMVKELSYGRAERKKRSPKSMPSIIRTALEMYADRHCLGVRDGQSYSWLTFRTIGDRAKNFGHGLRQLIEPRGYLAICSLSRPEWMITTLPACSTGSLVCRSIVCSPREKLFMWSTTLKCPSSFVTARFESSLSKWLSNVHLCVTSFAWNPFGLRVGWD